MRKALFFKRSNQLIFGFLFLFSIGALAQGQKSEFWSHVRFGGGIGLSFGDGFFSGTLAPSAIYDFDEKLSLGVGLNGTYNTQKNVYSSTVLGGSVLALYNIIPQLQISAEFEELHVSRTYDNGLFLDDNYWYPGLFLGAGFRQRNFTIGIRYDVLYDRERSTYANAYMPFVRVYF